MRLAISNLAWDVTEDHDVAQLLTKHHVDAIDIAPSKYFPEPEKAQTQDILKVKKWWSDRGLEVTGMQSLLFGTTGLNAFGTEDVQMAMLKHLDAVCRIGAGLGAPRLVFGSPKNRDRSGLSEEQAHSTAVSFFRRLGDIAQKHGVFVCLEPNHPSCGANFMTTCDETATVVQAVSHPAIKMHLDTGALTMNGENAQKVLEQHASLIGHIHASEPNLLPLGDHGTRHQDIYEALSTFLPHHVVSIEMIATKEEPHLVSIKRALLAAVNYYRP